MFETARAQSELLAFQCSQWELIWNSQLIGRYKEMSKGESWCLKLAELRVNSLLFSVVKWDLMWNSQLIGRYKEMSPGETYGQWELIWNSQLIGRYKEMSPGESDVWNWQSTEWTLCFSMKSMRAHLKQSTNMKIKRNVTRWIIWYTPLVWSWQSSEWTLCFSMQSMRAHLKQSTNKKI